jgi:DNA-binding transcriptional MerR regulator
MSGPNIRRLYYSASEIAEAAKIKLPVLAGWEAQFSSLRPTVRGGRRLYTPGDLETVLNIKKCKDGGQSNDSIREALSGRKNREAGETEPSWPDGKEAPHGMIDQELAAEILRGLREILQML